MITMKYHTSQVLSVWRNALPLTLLSSLLIATSLQVTAADAVTLSISGTLRKPSCEVMSEDQTMDIDLGTIDQEDLAQGAPTPTTRFFIRLIHCDIQTGEAKVTINGTGATGNNKQLALDSSSTATGIGIGFKQGVELTADLPLNTLSNGQALNVDTSFLHFGAYVQKLPNATMTGGGFSATATLSIEYL